MGPAQSIPGLLTHRYRGQAPSHPGYHWPLDGCKTWRPSRGPLCSSQRRQTCGGGLLPMGPAQSIPGLLTHCYRGQAPSHLGYRWSLDGCKTGRPSRGPLCSSQRRQTCGGGLPPPTLVTAGLWMDVKPGDRAGDQCAQLNDVKPVEGACPPMGPAQSIPGLLTHRHRGQAPSHLGLPLVLGLAQGPVGHLMR